MRSRWIRPSVLLIGAWALGAGIAGCSKKTTAPKPAAEQVNTYMPNANARITSQTIFGDADKRTYLGYLQRADDASLVFQGSYNDQWGVGTFNAGGSLRWFFTIDLDSGAEACGNRAGSRRTRRGGRTRHE